MKKIKSVFLLLLLFLSFTTPTYSQNENRDELFEAKITQVIAEKKTIRTDKSQGLQQNLKLIGLTGKFANKEFIVNGISDVENITANKYKVGDKVLVSYGKDIKGQDLFHINDYIRRDKLFILGAVFTILVVITAQLKGLRALFSLAISGLVIMKFIVPQIANGINPVLIGVLGALFIVVINTYFTEGINKKSHIAVLSLTITLFAVSILSVIVTNATRLTGLASEEAAFLTGLGNGTISFRGLLLAGILIGTLGVLDDIVIGQVEAVDQIRKANSKLANRKVFQMAFKIGTTHLSAVINTLFLAYTGAALPLLLLFNLQQPPFLTWGQVVNNEIIATEIVRTLLGSIALVCVIPLSTILAVKFLKS